MADVPEYDTGSSAINISSGNSARSEALEGLMVLGYNQSEIMPVLAGIKENLDTAGFIREALRIIGTK